MTGGSEVCELSMCLCTQHLRFQCTVKWSIHLDICRAVVGGNGILQNIEALNNGIP